MIAGHAPIAFVLVALAAAKLGVARRRTLALGLVAAGFAVVPDVDVAYAVVGVLAAAPADIWSANEVFWIHSKAVHRGITHSSALGIPAAIAFGLAIDRRQRYRLTAAGLLASLLVLAALVAGIVGFAMLALYVVAGLGVAWVARRADFGARTTLGAALVGIGSHPFGDLFTGDPPRLLYPLGVDPVPERIILLADPTLNLLSVFGLELAAIWAGILTGAWLLRVSIREYLDPRAVVGAGYGVAVLIVPPPTLELSYPFVFSVVAVGAIGVAPLANRVSRHTLARGFVTGLAAITLGGIAYAVGYLLV